MPQKGVTLGGGLELTSSKRSAAPGTLQYCKNFEIDGIKQGYTKAGGFVRYDGRSVWAPDSGGQFYTISTTSSSNNFTWTPGQLLSIGPPDQSTVIGTAFYAVLCTWSQTDLGGGSYRYTFVVRVTDNSIERPTTGATVSNYQLTEDLVIASYLYGINFGTTALNEASATAIESDYNDLISKVPGGQYTRIGGASIFKDKVYVVADYRTLLVVNGTYANIIPLEGDVIRKTSDSSVIGTIVKFTPTGDWGAATGVGVISVDTAGRADVSLSNGDDLEVYRSSTAYVIGDYFQDSTSNMRAGILTCGYNNDFQYTAISDAGDATQNRWTRVDLGRQLRYVGGQNGNAPIAYTRPGYVSEAGTIANTGVIYADEVSASGGLWANTSNATGAADGSYADETGAATISGLLTCKFDLSSIPDGATIVGVQVSITRRGGTANRAYDQLVAFGGITGLVANYARTSEAWPTTVAAVTYGSSTDTWGNALQTSQVKGDDFSVGIQFRRTAAVDGFVDAVGIQVWYYPQSTTAYIYNGSTDVATAQIIHYTVEDGAFDSGNDASGVMVVSGLLTDAEKTTLIGAGMQIRSAASGGGNLIATVASKDEPITLPDSAALLLPSVNTRYQMVEARPYAQDGTEVLFIANGVEPAVMFDGTYAIPIRTGLETDYEKPLHAAWWGNNLFLAYASGSIQVSATGDPVTFIANASDAAEIAVGDYITGLIPLKGQALAVCTKRSIYAIYGRDTSTFTLEIISPDVGGTPYSMVNAGIPILADQNGIQTLAAVQEYGNFARGRLSDAVTPWLRGRLQSGTRPDGLIGAAAMRSKGQYRQFFADGWILTGTLRPDGGMEFTTQRYELDNSSTDVGCQVLALHSGVFDDGTESLFFSFANRFDSNRNRFLYRADSGRRFDDVAMDCGFSTNFEHLGGVGAEVKVDLAVIFADAMYSTLTTKFGTAGIDGSYPYHSSNPQNTVGSLTPGTSPVEVTFDASTLQDPISMMRSVDVSADCFAIGMTVSINDESVGIGNAPITLQEVLYTFTPSTLTKR